jgi:hypothetical protein
VSDASVVLVMAVSIVELISAEAAAVDVAPSAVADGAEVASEFEMLNHE